MKYLYVKKKLDYDGTQLRSLHNYLNFDLHGDSLLAFEGACSVSLKHMVDGEDKKQNAKIEGDHMLHFLMEVFDRNLFTTVALQRLFASLVIDGIKDLTKNSKEALKLQRCGDDIYLGKKKLSISIATVSPTSQLMHFAVNVVNEGTPVETVCLNDLGVKPKELADYMGTYFVGEYQDILAATQKVHWVP